MTTTTKHKRPMRHPKMELKILVWFLTNFQDEGSPLCCGSAYFKIAFQGTKGDINTHDAFAYFHREIKKRLKEHQFNFSKFQYLFTRGCIVEWKNYDEEQFTLNEEYYEEERLHREKYPNRLTCPIHSDPCARCMGGGVDRRVNPR